VKHCTYLFPMTEAVQNSDSLEPDPWAPLVLSLGMILLLPVALSCLTSSDGGGVRGLSSLYILREIMIKIKDLDEEDGVNERIEEGDALPLPCNYFDFIIGTSTGG
jgi:hypothetical protein